MAAGVRSRGRPCTPGGRDPPSGHRPSCRDRSVAAATASMKAERTAFNSSVRTPAAVVPPGEVTSARKLGRLVARSRPSCGPNRARCPTTSCRLTSWESPAATPASISASATKKTYAGPDPDSPVTASRWRSGSRTTVPTAAEDALGPVEVGRGGRAPAGHGGHAGADERRACWASPGPPRCPAARAASSRPVRHAGHDREHPAMSPRGSAGQHRSAASGLTARTAPSAATGPVDAETGDGPANPSRWAGVGVGDRQFADRRPPGTQRPADQGRSHTAAAHHQQFRRSPSPPDATTVLDGTADGRRRRPRLRPRPDARPGGRRRYIPSYRGHGRREALVDVGEGRADDPVELVVVDPRHRHPADQVDGVLGAEGEGHAEQVGVPLAGGTPRSRRRWSRGPA